MADQWDAEWTAGHAECEFPARDRGSMALDAARAAAIASATCVLAWVAVSLGGCAASVVTVRATVEGESNRSPSSEKQSPAPETERPRDCRRRPWWAW